MKTLNPIQQALKDKWDTIIRNKLSEHNRYHDDAAGLAMTVVHWHHNLEYDIRNCQSDKSSFFCREYSRMVTEQWLWEVIQRLDLDDKADVAKRSYSAIADDEMTANNLRVALETYEINDKKV